MPITYPGLWAALVIPVIACAAPGGGGDPMGDDEPDPEPAEVIPVDRIGTALDTYDVRTVGDQPVTSITQLVVDPAGRTWVLHDDSDSLAGTPRPVLDRYRQDGELEQQLRFADGAFVANLVVHPSGRLSAFVVSPEPGQADQGCLFAACNLSIVAIAPDGTAAAPVRLAQAHGSSGQRVHVAAMADGDGLYVVAWTPGVMLYRLDTNYAPLWNAEIMPLNIGQAFAYLRETLARDESGNVFVGYQIFQDDIAIYNDHFQRTLARPSGLYSILVQGFDPAGGFLGARLFGGPGVNSAAGMSVHDGRIAIVGSARLTKYDAASSPNRTMEWDLVVLTGHLNDTAIDRIATIDVSRDDRALQAFEAADGSFLVAGRTDYVQVDTNSEVENGRGLLLTLDPDHKRATAIMLSGPRDVQIAANALLPDGSRAFAGIRNGPLTHTDPSQLNDEGIVGRFPPQLRAAQPTNSTPALR